MTNRYRESGNQVTINPGQAYTKGLVYMLGNIPAVALKTYASTDTEAVFLTEGVFDLPLNASDSAAIGAPAYWDASAGEVIDTPAADEPIIGRFWETTTDSIAAVKLGPATSRFVFAVSAALDLGAFNQEADIVVKVDTSGGAVEVDLPSAANMLGRTVTVYRDGTGTNAITIDQDGTETINGSATALATLDAQHDVVVLVSDGTNWIIQSSNIA